MDSRDEMVMVLRKLIESTQHTEWARTLVVGVLRTVALYEERTHVGQSHPGVRRMRELAKTLEADG